ncbi:MAG: hypothetical protein R2794_12555 [Chitinophagales bacterium]
MGLFSKFTGGKKGGHAAENAQAFIQKLTSDLGLSGDQAAQVEQAIRGFFADRKQIKQSGGSKDEMRGSGQDFKDHILHILSDEQKQKFMANIQEYKQLLRGR